MIGTVFKVLVALLTVALWVAVLRLFGIDLLALLAPFINALLVVLLAALAAWGCWWLFKAGYRNGPNGPNNTGVLLYRCGFILLAVSVVASGLFGGWQNALVPTVLFAVAAYALASPIAESGAARWAQEQRGEGISKLYGDARFAVFDGDLDQSFFSRLEHPIGVCPYLGHYEASYVPSFFHRVLLWKANLRNLLSERYPRSRFGSLVYDGPSHLVTIAPARSGKGACVIIPNLLTLKASVICIDPKGENASVTKRQRSQFGPVYLLNPFNEHGMGTSRYNPLAALDIRSPNVVADASGLAEALIIPEGNEPFFSDSARDLVRALILHLVATKGSEATLPEMRRLLTLASGEGENDKFGRLIFEMMESPYPFIAQPATRFQNTDRTTMSIISTAIAQTSFLDDPAIANTLSGSDFNIQDLKKQVATVYVVLPSRFLAPNKRFFRLLVVSAIDQLTAVAGGKRVLMLLDEFAQLGHLSAIETAFGLAAGYNLQLWLFLQDLNQLKDIYKARWETFLANAGVVQWFAPNDMTTAEYLSKRLGNKTGTTQSTTMGGFWSRLNAGTSGNTTKGETGIPLQTPQALMAMDEGVYPGHTKGKRQILNVSGISLPLLCGRERYDSHFFGVADPQAVDPEYRNWPEFRSDNGRLFDPNPFYSER